MLNNLRRLKFKMYLGLKINWLFSLKTDKRLKINLRKYQL